MIYQVLCMEKSLIYFIQIVGIMDNSICERKRILEFVCYHYNEREHLIYSSTHGRAKRLLLAKVNK